MSIDSVLEELVNLKIKDIDDVISSFKNKKEEPKTLKQEDEYCLMFSELISLLKALAIMSENLHWLSCGQNFYGDHLLFERIYNKVTEQTDKIAEKSITLFGESCVSSQKISSLICKFIDSLDFDNADKIAAFIDAEQYTMNLIKKIYEQLKKDEKITMGLDTMLMDLHDEHENIVYLLNRRMK